MGGACKDPEARLSRPDVITTPEPDVESEAESNTTSGEVTTEDEIGDSNVTDATEMEESGTTESMADVTEAGDVTTDGVNATTGDMGEAGEDGEDMTTGTTPGESTTQSLLSVLTSNDTEECEDGGVCGVSIIGLVQDYRIALSHNFNSHSHIFRWRR